MQRSQIYLSESHLGRLAMLAHERKTSQSALIREALDEYLARQAAVDKLGLRSRAFAAWSANDDVPALDALRAEERSF